MSLNTSVDKENVEKYLQETRSWEVDKVQALEKSKNIAWRIAIASSVLTFASVTAVVVLTPLKTIVPYVIRVDNSTGIVDVVNSLKDGETSYDEAINKYFTQWYVRYREGYSKELAEEYYSNVGIMSSALEQKKYYDFFNPKNSLSPLNIYGKYAKVKVVIKSTSFIKNDIALVRYSTEIEKGSDNPEVSHFAATITMKEKDRAVNPLGFQVIEYRNDPDALPSEKKLPLKTPVVSSQPSPVAFPAQENTPFIPKIQP
jgi:type IV secretion system protein VirB8